jgi:hypothetical protein
MKKQFLLNVLLSGLLCNCINNTTSNVKNSNSTKINPISKNDTLDVVALDLLLSCDNYAYFEEFYRIPYSGCVYDPAENAINKLGWADIILIPRQSFKSKYLGLDDEKIDSVVQSVNEMTTEEIKKRFNVFVFVIDKKHLQAGENQEIKYYPKYPCPKKIFQYSFNVKKWIFSDSTLVQDESEDNEWVRQKISEQLLKE